MLSKAVLFVCDGQLQVAQCFCSTVFTVNNYNVTAEQCQAAEQQLLLLLLPCQWQIAALLVAGSVDPTCLQMQLRLQLCLAL